MILQYVYNTGIQCFVWVLQHILFGGWSGQFLLKYFCYCIDSRKCQIWGLEWTTLGKIFLLLYRFKKVADLGAGVKSFQCFAIGWADSMLLYTGVRARLHEHWNDFRLEWTILVKTVLIYFVVTLYLGLCPRIIEFCKLV